MTFVSSLSNEGTGRLPAAGCRRVTDVTFRGIRSLFNFIRNVVSRPSGARRYEFQREQAGVWTLCFDPTVDTWQVERLGTGGQPLRFTISEFEATDDGKRMAANLDKAIQAAAGDA